MCVHIKQRENMWLWVVLLCVQALNVSSFLSCRVSSVRACTGLRSVEVMIPPESKVKPPRWTRYPVAPRPMFFRGRKEDIKGKGVKWDKPLRFTRRPLRVQADGLVYPQGEPFGEPNEFLGVCLWHYTDDFGDRVEEFGGDHHHRVCVLHRGTVIPEGLELVRYMDGGTVYSLLPSAPCTVRTYNKNIRALATQMEELTSEVFLERYANHASPLYETFPYYPTAEHP